VLGSILRNSHKDYVKVRLEHMLREAINTYALPLLHLHNLQDRYHIMHKSFMQGFTHLFRTLPPSLTQEFADLLGDTFVRLFDYCTGGRRTKLPKDPNIELVEQVHYYRLFLSYKAGGMGLADPHMLRHTAFLGCWTSLLTYEGAERWKHSFPGLANMCTDLVLGDGQCDLCAGSAAAKPRWTVCPRPALRRAKTAKVAAPAALRQPRL
jgi:hypothetical protein